MAKNNDLVLWAIVGILAYAVFAGGGSTTTTTTGGGSVDLCQVVQPSASFTGQRMFLEGTSITSEFVRAIKINGEKKDLGQISLNSGTLSTAPNGKYNLYYGENGTTYYGSIEQYTVPCQDAVDNKVGVLCTMDTAPTVTVFDEYGNVQSASANAQALGTDDSRDVIVRVRTASDKCYGNPDADVAGTNAMCFKYNTTVIKSMKADTGSIAVPYPISSVYGAAGYDISCYSLKKLADNEQTDIKIKIDTQSTQPTYAHNVTIYFDDVDFDLDEDTLAQINGFADEDNNALGVAVSSATLYTS